MHPDYLRHLDKHRDASIVWPNSPVIANLVHQEMRDMRVVCGIYLYRVFQIYHLKILQQRGNVQQIFSGGVLGRGGGQGQQEDDEGCCWCHGAECAHAAGCSLSMEPLLTKQGLDNHSSAARYN